MSNSVLRVENIVKQFGGVTAVNNLSLDIADGEFFALLGPSGCGKTTLLRMLGGFDHPTSGRIFMDGEEITHLPPNKRQINMLFQSYAVFPHMTVEENVGYGLRMEKCAADEIDRRVAEALSLVHMGEFAKRMPDKLSGGQRQRVALARALIKKPRVLLLDEPLSALDAKLREAMQTELVRLQKTVGITFVVVTHDQDEALSMANRIAVMQDGVFRQIDTPRVLYESPQSRFVADFIGRMNLSACTLLEAAADAQRVNAGGEIGEMQIPVPPIEGVTAGAQVHYGVRPEKILFGSDKPEGFIHCAAVLESYSYYGDETMLHLRRTDGEMWICNHTNRSREFPVIKLGQTGFLSWHPDDMILVRE